MKTKLSFSVGICALLLLFAVGCNKYNKHVELKPEKSEIDFNAQTVRIFVKNIENISIDNLPDFGASIDDVKYTIIKSGSGKEFGTVTQYIEGPCFKVTIPPHPIKEILVDFDRNDTGEKRLFVLQAFGTYIGQCIITQYPE